MKVYDKALRTRRVMVDELNSVFGEYGAILIPATSKAAYAAGGALDSCFDENIFTAPASISGMPSVVSGGASLVGAAFTEGKLLSLAKIFEKEGAL
jgi:Asp-tRNA(Asn)/Glu-tRNA(Gln) amidotransferase A subunit family amidase